MLSTLETHYDFACHIAARLHGEPNLAGVELFGSTARGTSHASSDIDLILLVPEAVYQWCCGTLTIMGRGSLVDRRALMLLLFLGTPAQYLERMSQGHRLDVFLLPENWRERLCQLPLDMANPVTDMFHNIAADARPWNPALKDFEPLPKDPEREARQRRIAGRKQFYRSQDV